MISLYRKSTTASAVESGVALVTTYLVNEHTATKTYLFPSSDLGNGPSQSTNHFSQGLNGTGNCIYPYGNPAGLFLWRHSIHEATCVRTLFFIFLNVNRCLILSYVLSKSRCPLS